MVLLFVLLLLVILHSERCAKAIDYVEVVVIVVVIVVVVIANMIIVGDAAGGVGIDGGHAAISAVIV